MRPLLCSWPYSRTHNPTSLPALGSFLGHLVPEVPAQDREHTSSPAESSGGQESPRCLCTCSVAGAHGAFCGVIAHLLLGISVALLGQQGQCSDPALSRDGAAGWKKTEKQRQPREPPVFLLPQEWPPPEVSTVGGSLRGGVVWLGLPLGLPLALLQMRTLRMTPRTLSRVWVRGAAHAQLQAPGRGLSRPGCRSAGTCFWSCWTRRAGGLEGAL